MANLRDALPLLAICGLVFGCDDDSSSPGPDGFLRAGNYIADGDGLAVVDANNNLLAGVVNGSSSTLLAGSPADVTLTLSHVTPFDTAEFAERTIAIESNRMTTALVLGSVGSERIVTIVDDSFDQEANAGMARVRMAHGAADLGRLDFYLTESSAERGMPAATLGFGEHSAEALVVAAGDYELRIAPEGAETTLFASGRIVIGEFDEPAYVAIEDFGAGTVRVGQAGLSGGAIIRDPDVVTGVRVFNAVSDLAGVDVYVDGELLFENVAYRQLTERLSLPPGSARTIQFTAAGDAEDVVELANLTFASGRWQTLLVAGQHLTDDTGGRGLLEDPRPVSLYAKVAFLNTMTGSGPLDVHFVEPGAEVGDSTPHVVNAPFLAYVPTVPVEAGEYDVIVEESGSDVVVLGPERMSFDAAEVAFMALVDATDGGPPELLVVER